MYVPPNDSCMLCRTKVITQEHGTLVFLILDLSKSTLSSSFCIHDSTCFTATLSIQFAFSRYCCDYRPVSLAFVYVRLKASFQPWVSIVYLYAFSCMQVSTILILIRNLTGAPNFSLTCITLLFQTLYLTHQHLANNPSLLSFKTRKL